MKLVVAIGGASGSVYAKRLLDALVPLQSTVEVGLVFTQSGNEVWNHEIGDAPAYPFKKYGLRDFRAPFASGSAGWDAMVVIPCSTGGLASGDVSSQLVQQPLRVDRSRRAADRDDDLHDATTIVATPDGNSAFVSTAVKPTSFSSAASSAGERKRPIDSGR